MPVPITDLDIESTTRICSLSALCCLLLILFFQILHYAQSKLSVPMNYRGHSENAYTIIFTHGKKVNIEVFDRAVYHNYSNSKRFKKCGQLSNFEILEVW